MALGDESFSKRTMARIRQFFGVTNTQDLSSGPTVPATSIHYGMFSTAELRHVDGIVANPKSNQVTEMDIIGQLKEVSSNSKKMMDEIDTLKMMAPEISMAETIIISSIMSPVDLQTDVVSVAVDSKEISEDTQTKINELLTNYFNDEYKLGPKLVDWLGTAAFHDGAKAIMILPQTEIDVLNRVADDWTPEEIKDYEKENSGASLEEYLQSVSLVSDTDEIQTDDYLVLSTVHSVKGLEFDVVFVTGLEENVFPSQSYNKTTSEIEEERRVMYVAMTRARKRLYLTCARSRFMYGSTQYNPKSRFMKEADVSKPASIPTATGGSFTGGAPREAVEQPKKRDLSEILRSVNGARADVSNLPKGDSGFKLGDKVVHPRYGVGRIIQVNGDNASIAFDGLGIKQFNMKIAPFKKA